MKKDNNGIKFIIFILVVSLSSLLFFGLGETPKNDLQLMSFYFILLAEFIVYLSNILPGMLNSTVLTAGDLISASSIYAFLSFLLNITFVKMVYTVKNLVVYNIALVIILLLVISIIYMVKNNNQK